MNIVFYLGTSRRACVIADAWEAGLARHGLTMRRRAAWQYTAPEADVAVMYGLKDQLRQVMLDYAAAGRTAILVDLGYWGRILNGDKLRGYHRISVNAWHATAYFQRVRHPADRWRHFNAETRPFRRQGHHVLLAGMSAKAAWVYDLPPEAWERSMAAVLARTGRPVWYRPKPSWRDASPIPGTVWKPAKAGTPLPLENCWGLVTHHGNAALEALAAGVPVSCEDGLARPLATAAPYLVAGDALPDEAARDQLLADMAYTQYSVAEIGEGLAWAYLRDEGLM